MSRIIVALEGISRQPAFEASNRRYLPTECLPGVEYMAATSIQDVDPLPASSPAGDMRLVS